MKKLFIAFFLLNSTFASAEMVADCKDHGGNLEVTEENGIITIRAMQGIANQFNEILQLGHAHTYTVNIPLESCTMRTDHTLICEAGSGEITASIPSEDETTQTITFPGIVRLSIRQGKTRDFVNLSLSKDHRIGYARYEFANRNQQGCSLKTTN